FYSMQRHRIWAIILRHLLFFRKNLDYLTGIFYWPVINLLLWGLASEYFEARFAVGGSTIVFAIVSGIIFWMIAERAEFEFTFGILQELWDKNLVNLFATPLKFSEWVVAFLLLAIFKGMFTFVFSAVVAMVLYDARVFEFGLLILPFAILLIMTGWWIGALIAGLVLRYGTRVQALAWTVPALIAPFSAIYYPVSILPEWAQKIAYLLPTTYVFEGMRDVLARGVMDYQKLLVSVLLNVLYLAAGFFFLAISFKKAKQKGLAKVY
ncbi:MAG: ABC-2 type transport system permease protein, partial [Parcubacteria group bacterium Gr01-1014_66]